jgi:hypothetical protein
VVLPFDVEPMEAADLDPRPTELMMAAAGMALVNAAHAATCFPDLWPSAEASKKAFQRRRNGTNPEEELLSRECPTPPAAISYQLVGAGQKPCVAWCDQSRVPDPAAWLTGRLGPLAKALAVWSRCRHPVARGAGLS